MRSTITAAAAIVLCMSTPVAFAAERCSVKVVRDARAEEDPSSVLHKGDKGFGYVTQVRVGKKSGRLMYCSHGTYCYPGASFEFTSPCRLALNEADDPDDFYYDAR